MSDTAAELVVDVSAKESVTSVLTRLEAQLERSDATAQRLAAALEAKLARGQGAAKNSADALYQAQVRLKVAQGDLAGAIGLVEQRLAGLEQGSLAAVRAETQLAQLQTRVNSGASAFQQFGEAAKSSLLGVIGPAAAAGAAFATAEKVIASFGEAIKFKAELDSTNAAIRAQLTGVRDANQVYAEGQSFANRFKLTQQELTEALQASVGVMRTSRASTEDILTTFARLQVLAPEKPISEAARAVRELATGDTTSIKELFNISAKDANRMKLEIQGGADAIAVVSKYLDTAGIGMDALTAKTTGAMGAMKDLAQANESLALAQAQFAQGPGLAILNERIAVTLGLTRLLNFDTQQMGQSFQQSALQGTTSYQGLIGALGPLGGALDQVVQFARAHQDAQAADAAQTQATTATTAENTAGVSINTSTIDLQSQAMIQAAQARQVAVQAILNETAATQASSEQSVIAAASQQAQTAQIELLTLQTNAAVQEFLNLNPNISASGVAAAVAAGQISPLIGQLAAAALQARDAANAMAEFRTQAALGVGVSGIDAHGNAVVGGVRSFAVKQDQENTKKLRDGQIQLAQAQGQTTRATALLRQEQAQYTKGSAEWLGIEARITSLQSKGRRGGGGASAGAAKLSDQQKLDNQLLSQAEKTDNQLEDLDLKHNKRLLEIERDAAKKRLEADRQFHQGRLDGEASFYSQLGSVGSSGNAKADQELRKQLSARYEAAALEADQIAREKGADAGEAFLQASAQAIQQEGEIQDKINKAREDKNGDEAAYWEGVLRLQQQANQNRLENVKAEGSQIAAERQQQIDAENDQYAEQATKIETSSTRAADAQIRNAQRAGKAVSDVAAQYDTLGQSIDRVAAKSGGPVPTAPTAAPSAPTPEAPAAPSSAASIVAALQSVQVAIVDALSKVERAERDTTNAVRAGRATGGLAG